MNANRFVNDLVDENGSNHDFYVEFWCQKTVSRNPVFGTLFSAKKWGKEPVTVALAKTGTSQSYHRGEVGSSHHMKTRWGRGGTEAGPPRPCFCMGGAEV